MNLVPLLLSAAMATESLPTIMVLEIEAKGTKAELASILTDTLLQELRASRVFGKLVSAKEMEAAVSLESQRQLVNCDSTGCLAELAGSLGADFVLTASLGSVGEYYATTLKLVSAKAGTIVGTASARVCAAREGELIPTMGALVRTMLQDAQLAPAAVERVSLDVVCTAAPPPVTVKATGPVQSLEPAAEPSGGSMVPVVVRLAGVAFLVGAAMPALGMFLAAAIGGGAYAWAAANKIPAGTTAYNALMVPNLGGWLLVPVSLLLHVVAVLGGVALLVASFIL